MGYQESWLYIEPQRKFEKLIQGHVQTVVLTKSFDGCNGDCRR